MKKIGFLGLLLLGGALTAAPLFDNFESGLEWSKSADKDAVTLVDDADASHGKVMKIVAKNNIPWCASREFYITPSMIGKSWTIEFDLRTEGEIKGLGSVGMQYFDKNNKRIGMCSVLYLGENLKPSGWNHNRHFVGTGKRIIPANAVKASLRIGFWNKERDCTGTIYVDNVKVVPPQPADEEVWSRDFELGKQGWKPDPASSLVELVDESEGAYGRVLKLTAQNNIAGVQSPYIPVPVNTAGKSWSVEFDLRTEGELQGTGLATMHYWDENKKILNRCTVRYINNSTDFAQWKHFKAFFGTNKRTLPEKTAFVTIRFGFWNKERNCSGSIYVDNIEIVPPTAD